MLFKREKTSITGKQHNNYLLKVSHMLPSALLVLTVVLDIQTQSLFIKLPLFF